MLKETKIYSDWIKANKIIVYAHSFMFRDEEISLEKDHQGWRAGQDDACFTKKAAIYWYIKNRL